MMWFGNGIAPIVDNVVADRNPGVTYDPATGAHATQAGREFEGPFFWYRNRSYLTRQRVPRLTGMMCRGCFVYCRPAGSGQMRTNFGAIMNGSDAD